MDGASFTLLDSLSSIVIVLNIGEPAFVSAFTAFESSCNDLVTVVRNEVSIDPSTCIKIRYHGTLCISTRDHEETSSDLIDITTMRR